MPPNMTTPMSAETRSRASSWRVVNFSWKLKKKTSKYNKQLQIFCFSFLKLCLIIIYVQVKAISRYWQKCKHINSPGLVLSGAGNNSTGKSPGPVWISWGPECKNTAAGRASGCLLPRSYWSCKTGNGSKGLNFSERQDGCIPGRHHQRGDSEAGRHPGTSRTKKKVSSFKNQLSFNVWSLCFWFSPIHKRKIWK